MAENENIKLTVERWAEIVIKEWINMAAALKINNSGALVASFNKYISDNSGGDVNKISFAFEWYGRMIDYGVGKGVNLKDRDMMIHAKLTKRRPKPWLSDTLYKQVEVLRHLLEEKYALKTETIVVRNISDNADYGFKSIKVD